MTRFARAKGSKSSNERLPNEATPWHVMKQQLESALDKGQEPQTKTKSAKQLLNEKEDVYYAKSLGNTNVDWAEFECPRKTNAIKNGKVEKKSKNQNKVLKKSYENAKAEESTINHKCTKEEKQSKNVAKSMNEEITVNDKTKVDTTVQMKLENISENVIDNTKNKKNKRKTKDTLQNRTEREKTSEPKVKVENVSKIKNEDGESLGTKLSKRQKRNQKKQNQKIDEMDERRKTAAFNTEGNDWDNSVSFNKRRKFDDNQDRRSMGNGGQSNFNDKRFNSNFNEDKNFRRFGNNVPRKYQKKTAKFRDDKDHPRRKPDFNSLKVTINGMDIEIVKYDGFPIKKEDAERLTELRKEMVMKGIPKSEVDAAMKLERRKCEKALARIRKQVCFHCRKAGHNLSDCPELGKEEAGTGICFKCGSTEHTHFECKVNKSDDYRYAKCFICREQGHIAKQCPDNPKGLYPDGGSCKICGDVTHLKKDCPDLVKEKEDTSITLDTIKDKNLEILENETTKTKTEVKTKKIIKF